MSKGKQTCKILKDIRRQISEANDIEYITSECRYKGDCLGTCPKCEAEIRYLEQALERRRLAGKVVSLLGISVGLMTFSQTASSMDNDMAVAREMIYQSFELSSSGDTIVVKGQVVDSTGAPLSGVTIMEKGTNRGVCSDANGCFTFQVSGKRQLVFSYIGLKRKEVVIPKNKISDLRVVMKEEEGVLMGEAPVVAYKKVFAVEGLVTDENGIPLSRVAIINNKEGKEHVVFETDSLGKFSVHLWENGYFYITKDGYQTLKVRFGKKNSSGIRIILKKEN